MSIEPFKRGPIERMDIVHTAIGGAICFGITVLVLDIVYNGLPYLLYNLNMAGVTFFAENYMIARALFTFGLVYLTSGFCGGVYTGYNVYANLKILLVIPALISTIGYILLMILVANYPITSEFVIMVVLQFIGNTIGSFLGGYAINWKFLTEESNTKPSEKFTLEMQK
ncbi:MAG: hypothetical protein QW051_04215 [Candidatus Aenigmatarchaeota archaeon]